MAVIIGQLRYFGASILWGILLMACYDVILAFRTGVKHNQAARLIGDWLFFAFAAWIVFQMIFALNDGIIRSFFVISFLGGMYAYRKIMKNRLEKGIVKLFRLFLRPFGWLSKKIGKSGKKT